MLIGDGDGMVSQYSLNFQRNPGKVIKHYGNLGLGCIYSSSILGHIAVFGGSDGKLGFIHTQNREFLGIRLDLAAKYIYSIQFFWIRDKQSPPKALLTVSGREYDYSFKTDVLDVTQLFLKEEKVKNFQTLKRRSSILK